VRRPPASLFVDVCLHLFLHLRVFLSVPVCMCVVLCVPVSVFIFVVRYIYMCVCVLCVSVLAFFHNLSSDIEHCQSFCFELLRRVLALVSTGLASVQHRVALLVDNPSTKPSSINSRDTRLEP